MPLPTNYSRPSLPYAPLQSLPNDRRFVNLTTLQQPPTAEMFDAELNAILDKINTLAAAINVTVAGNIPGSDNPDNAGKFLVTDGAGNLSFILVGSDNITLNAIATALLQNQAVTQEKIGDGAVGADQLADGGVLTAKLADLAVSNAKLQPVPLSKTRASGTPCIVVGQTGGSHYGEATLNLNPFGIVTMGTDGKMNVYNLSSVWYYSNVTYDGSKLTNQSVTLGKITVGVNNAGVVGSGDGTTAASFINADNQIYGVLSGGGGNNVSFRKIAQVLNNDNANVGAINGAILQVGSVDFGAINPAKNPLGNVKFFDAGYQSNNQNHDFYLFKSFTGVWNGTGIYDFTIVGNYRTGYFMVSVAFANVPYRYFITQTTTYSFRLSVVNNNGNPADAAFSIMIWGVE
jgi:hypothetical protein